VGRLEIALQDGFDHDTVVVSIDGAEVFRKDGVTTRTQISLADSFEVDAPDGSAQLRIDVPSRGVSDSVAVNVQAHPYVALSLRNGSIESRFPERLGFA
jgi:hypothetical protein